MVNFILCPIQSVVTPNGLVAHMFGPMEGRRHDAFMLSVSGLPNKLRPLSQPNGQPYVLYGDPAYGLSRNILSPFRGAHLTPLEQDFNQKMSAVRVSVEWEFGKILQQFSYLDFKKKLKSLTPACKEILLSRGYIYKLPYLPVWIANIIFGVSPPSLETYLSNQ